jgi:hypothetical protein
MKKAVFLVLAACGSQTAPVPTPTGPAAAMQEKPAPDDIVVATVNGKPVYGSCLTAQGPHAKSRQDALDQCIAFELMAQEADARGIASDHEVVEATRTALVNQLVALDYEDKLKEPSDFGNVWNQIYAKNKLRYDHPEYRGSAYTRIDVPEGAPAAQDEAAHALANEIAAALAPERGLMPPQMKEIAERVVGTRGKVSYAVVPPYTHISTLDIVYADALFAIPEVGRTSPAVKTPWGWDVILYSDVVPEEHQPESKIVSETLPDVQRTFFPQWTNQVAQRLGVKIQVFEDKLPLLEKL